MFYAQLSGVDGCWQVFFMWFWWLVGVGGRRYKIYGARRRTMTQCCGGQSEVPYPCGVGGKGEALREKNILFPARPR